MVSRLIILYVFSGAFIFYCGLALGMAIAQKRIDDTAAIDERLDILADTQVKHSRAIEMLAANQDAVIEAINGMQSSLQQWD